MQPELQDCTPRATVVLKSCDFPAGAACAYYVCTYKLQFLSRKAAADQAGIEPATARLREQARRPRDNFQRPVRKQQNRTAPQRERFDTHDPRRGSREHIQNRKTTQSLHIDHLECQNRRKNPQFLTSTTRISAEGRSHRSEIVKKSSVFLPPTRISAKGRSHRSEIVRSPQFSDLDQRVDFRSVLSALPRRPKKRRKQFKTRHE